MRKENDLTGEWCHTCQFGPMTKCRVLCLHALPLPLSHRFISTIYTDRSSGHTINSAMEEGVSGVAKNKYVHGAVKSGVKAGVSAAYDSK